MAKYRVLATSFVGNRIVQPGDTVDLDGEVSPINFEPADKEATKATAAKSVPREVDELTSAIKLHTATRGVPPTEVNEGDFDAVLAALTPRPSDATIKAAAEKLGVTLGQSVA